MVEDRGDRFPDEPGAAGGEGAGREAPASSLPGPRATILFLVLVWALFLLGGGGLALFLGQPGILLGQLLFLLLPALVFVRLGGFDLSRVFPLRLPTSGQMGGGILILLGGLQVAWFLAWFQSLFMPVPVEYLEAMAGMLQPESLLQFLWLLLLVAVVPAVSEEVLFRGVVLSGFRGAMPAVWAVVAAGLAFGAFHLLPETAFRFLPTAWLGILLGWVVVVTGSLPLAIVLHFLNNALILSLTALPATGEVFADAEQEPPFLLLPVAVLVLAWGLRILHAEPRSVPE